MRRSLIRPAISTGVALAIAGLTLTACGGSPAPLTADEVVPKLEAAGIDCTETSSEPFGEGVAATAVSCAIGESGGVAVVVAESADDIAKAKSELCAASTGTEADLEVAAGDTWLAVTLSTAGLGAAQVSEALGGKVVKIKDYCAA